MLYNHGIPRLIELLPFLMRFFRIAITLLILCTTQAHSESIGALRDQLNRIEKESVQLRAKITSARTKSKSIQNQADRSEKAIKEANTHLDEIEKELKQQQQKRLEIDDQLAALSGDFDAARQQIVRLLKAQYVQQSNSELRFLVSSGTVAAHQQYAKWNTIINGALSKRINTLSSDIEAGQSISEQLVQASDDLSDELKRIEQHREILDDKLKGSLTALNEINSNIKLNEGQLAQLQKDKARLSNLVDKLVAEQVERQKAQQNAEKKTASTQKPRDSSAPVIGKNEVYNLPSGSFTKSRGKMGLPVAGRLIVTYNQANPSTGLKSDGITLTVARGARVNAIFGGKVVYAGFFKGFGQMVIIDHQGEYLSLYTLDGNISVVEGQNVDMGTAIGKTAASGDGNVYFEIRHGKDTVDPLSWCRKDAVATKIN